MTLWDEMGSLITSLLQNYGWVQRWKNFENQLTFGEGYIRTNCVEQPPRIPQIETQHYPLIRLGAILKHTFCSILIYTRRLSALETLWLHALYKFFYCDCDCGEFSGISGCPVYFTHGVYIILLGGCILNCLPWWSLHSTSVWSPANYECDECKVRGPGGSTPCSDLSPPTIVWAPWLNL